MSISSIQSLESKRENKKIRFVSVYDMKTNVETKIDKEVTLSNNVKDATCWLKYNSTLNNEDILTLKNNRWLNNGIMNAFAAWWNHEVDK